MAAKKTNQPYELLLDTDAPVLRCALAGAVSHSQTPSYALPIALRTLPTAMSPVSTHR